MLNELSSCVKYRKKLKTLTWDPEMALHFIALVALAQDPSSDPSTHTEAQEPETTVPGDITSSSGLCGYWYTHGICSQRHIHIKKIKVIQQSLPCNQYFSSLICRHHFDSEKKYTKKHNLFSTAAGTGH